MLLEYLHDGSEDCPLIRIYHFNRAEAKTLRRALLTLARGSVSRLAFHELPGMEPVKGCQLFGMRDRRDIGIERVDSELGFECRLTRDGWRQAADIAKPIAAEPLYGFNWLWEGEIQWLLSFGGEW